MAKQSIGLGTNPNDGTGDALRIAFDKVNDNFDEVYADDFITTARIADDSVTTDKIAGNAITFPKLSGTFTSEGSITTLTGTVSFDCDSASTFKLSGDLTGAYTIELTGYTRGQVITIYPLKGNQTLNLSAQGSSTNTFNKIGGDYNDDGTASNVLQIECVDESSTDPVFFYSIAEFTADSSDI